MLVPSVSSRKKKVIPMIEKTRLDYEKPRIITRNANYGSVRTARTLQSTAISSGCNEALSVKKSAEIAALFADIKLSQTTDITHLTSKNFDAESVISRGSYIRPPPQPKYSKPSKLSTKYLDPKSIGAYGPKSLQGRGANGIRNGKNNMYSAKNGLYTIQSQSDESRRSSVSEGRKISESREYFDLEPQFERNIENVSSNIENSL
ncbi:hypothetical protein NQ315_013706, partial [Exocentrus adspersus]